MPMHISGGSGRSIAGIVHSSSDAALQEQACALAGCGLDALQGAIEV